MIEQGIRGWREGMDGWMLSGREMGDGIGGGFTACVIYDV